MMSFRLAKKLGLELRPYEGTISNVANQTLPVLEWVTVDLQYGNHTFHGAVFFDLEERRCKTTRIATRWEKVIRVNPQNMATIDSVLYRGVRGDINK